MILPPSEIVLASASAARRQMLADAGVTVDIQPADIDEDAIKQASHLTPSDLALRLAIAKAETVSAMRLPDLVIGSDQVLSLEGVTLSKPPDIAAARHQLQALRSRTHELHTAVVLASGGLALWQHCAVARLTMRSFSEAFLDRYIETEGEALCQSVGAYRIEGLGLQLFEAVEGDHFVIMGMPLLPLLNELRRRGAIES
ncbi:MAG: hypothetical protein RLZ98_410 [Pseudomonadota bacterium]